MRIDRRPRDAVQLEQRLLQLTGPDLHEVRHSLDSLRLGAERRGAYPSARAATGEEHVMAFSVPALPYPFDALEPTIDAKTMEIHHDKHHQAYVDNAEQGARRDRMGGPAGRGGARATSTRGPEDIRAAVQNNAGGHANHSLFWEIMGPNGGGEPTGALARRDRRGLRRLRRASRRRSTKTGVKRFGSGWSWLVWNGSGLRCTRPRTRTRPLLQGHDSAARHRRLGARLLPELPEQAPGLPRGVVGRRELGRRRSTLRDRPLVASAQTGGATRS